MNSLTTTRFSEADGTDTRANHDRNVYKCLQAERMPKQIDGLCSLCILYTASAMKKQANGNALITKIRPTDTQLRASAEVYRPSLETEVYSIKSRGP